MVLELKPTVAALALVLLTLLPSVALAQQTATVTGIVRTQGGVALPGVAVRFEPSGTAAISDARGRFALRVPPAVEGAITVLHGTGVAPPGIRT